MRPSAIEAGNAGARLNDNSSMRFLIFILVGMALLASILWLGDKITLQGERTVYTVDCQQGSWQGQRCNGRMVAAHRVRFRILKAHREVLVWNAGGSETSGKFTDCEIKDGRNWKCQLHPDAPSTVTHQMVHGQPIPDPASGKPLHTVAKWHWWLLRWGLSLGHEAGP